MPFAKQMKEADKRGDKLGLDYRAMTNQPDFDIKSTGKHSSKAERILGQINSQTKLDALGEKTGLYKDEMVSKGCTPNYLPAFIAIESHKRNKQ